MNIGFVCPEYFGYRKKDGGITPTSAHGGFGFLTKTKAEYLASVDYNVHVFTYLSSFGKDMNVSDTFVENGVKIHLIPEKERIGKNSVSTAVNYFLSSPRGNDYFREIIKDEDIQILQFEDTPTTLMLAETHTIPKILVFQDPFDYYDNNLLIDSEQSYLNLLKGNQKFYTIKESGNFSHEKIINILHKKNFINPINRIIKRSSLLSIFAEANFIGKKVENLFNLEYTPNTLRNPINIFKDLREKTERPSFVWIGRWDPQKRPDSMLYIASKLPNYDFYMIGTATRGSRNYITVEKKLSSDFSKYPNIHILGFIDEQAKRGYVGKAWGLINTSVREGLPITFLEALAEGTPIISYVDPDNYVSRFGIKADYTQESFINAIEQAVSERLFQKIGEDERSYAINEHALDVVMKKHIHIYRNLEGENLYDK